MSRLSPIEAFRAQILLDDSLVKLEFVDSLGASSPQAVQTGAGQRDELSEFMGDEITRIINEQRELERQYEELILERGQLKGLMNKAQFKETQAKIQEVAHRLRESNKSLCRNLKESPNMQGNLAKLSQERARVYEWYEDCRKELDEFFFNRLALKVETGRKNQEMLQEKRRQARETAQAVRILEKELQREYQEHEKETKTANQEIATLKEELQRLKNQSAITLTFEEKKLRAKEAAVLRIFARGEKDLVDLFGEHKEARELELIGHEKAVDFVQWYTQNVIEDKMQWDEDYKRDVKQKDDELNELNANRGKLLSLLQKLRDRFEKEHAEQEERDKEARNQAVVEKLRRSQREREAAAIGLIQAIGRQYLDRLRVRMAGKKKKGKKGKGKKKKKK
ncbi:unnamed protein product [Vitrella brassicaformis CCMP3155]|uniref:Dynein regulatory complex protein 9 n=1 Tax=Vitrella brassicaformis (strain CCMP3155) TaxID=1169540 RepID=A0A0G4G013_VITBC|nr:unnamed protein product [Vitrella brassicaformis CCMP3155]|eukprot:CEM20842.1 unnamed protein product [Vitrella brassicaformis CCMP3155]